MELAAGLTAKLEKLPEARLNCFAELVFQGDDCRDGGSVVGRRDLKATATLTHPLLNTRKADPRDDFIPVETFRGHAFSGINDLYLYSLRSSGQPDIGGGAAGVAVDVGKALLHDAEESNLHARWKTAEIGSHLQIDFNVAALSKTFHIPLNGGR